ncbi:response regulator [Roseicella aquatilis]|uniref:histidine kinase n=1 Tax=Roseicella aquatilis TaxID=2527868 RepID=A0A4R4DHB1_9PROT|nr:response regulator [Roseicella aquatilis]TCZ59695.1 response regulator [Roseicella aquatilis]
MADHVSFLLVDDRPENLDVLEALLRREGLDILRAGSGPEALELLLVHDVALALLDVQMPDMSGFELAELMRGTARTRDVPIIFLTASGHDEERRFRGYEAGAVDFLEKPLDADILRQKADVFFRLDRQRRDLLRQRDALEASEARFRAIVESEVQILFRVDPSGAVLEAPGWTAVTGQPREALVGDGWLARIHPEDRAQAAALWAERPPTQKAPRVPYRVRTGAGTWRWFEGFAAAVRDDAGRITEWVGTAIDIHDRRAAEQALHQHQQELEQLVEERTAALLRAADEQRRAEEASRQAEKLAALGQLTGGVAHDFSNLLQVIASGVSLLARPKLTETRQAKVIEGMQAAVESARTLTGRLLAFARQQPLAPETFDLAQRLPALSGLLRSTLGAGIRVETDTAPDLWPIRCDPTQLEVALLNLAVNARDAMPRGGTLAIRASNTRLPAEGERAAGDYVLITVRDTGEGMPPAVLARAFEPFFTTKEVGKGTGLGLPQVFGFARQSEGEVRIESEPGRGTTVLICLPRATEAAAAARDRQAAASRGAVMETLRSSTGRTVLVVEDNEQAGDFAAQLLEELGYQTLRAGSGPEALEMLAELPEVDAVFSDIVMPGGVNGVQLSTWLRQRHPRLAVLLATGYSATLVAEGLPEGVEVLRKPYRLDDLASGLRRAFAAVAPEMSERALG